MRMRILLTTSTIAPYLSFGRSKPERRESFNRKAYAVRSRESGVGRVNVSALVGYKTVFRPPDYIMKVCRHSKVRTGKNDEVERDLK